MATLLAFEAWTPSLALEEGAKGFVQVQKRLIRCILGDVPGPRELLPPDRVELLLELERAGFLASFRLPVPFCQRPVPSKTSGSCGSGKIGLLLLSRVKAIFSSE